MHYAPPMYCDPYTSYCKILTPLSDGQFRVVYSYILQPNTGPNTQRFALINRAHLMSHVTTSWPIADCSTLGDLRSRRSFPSNVLK